MATPQTTHITESYSRIKVMDKCPLCKNVFDLDDDGLGGTPVGLVLDKFCMSISQQFNYIPEDILAAAWNFKLDPHKGHRLLDPLSQYLIAVMHDNPAITEITSSGFVSQPKYMVKKEQFQKLLEGIPTPAHSLQAWSIAMVLGFWSNRDGAQEMQQALEWFGRHIVEWAAKNTWGLV